MLKDTIFILCYLTPIFLFIGLSSPAYADSCGVSHIRKICDKPTFTDEIPAKDSSVSAFSELSFVASGSLKESSLVVKVNGEPIRVKKEKKRTGKIKVHGKVAKSIITPGLVLVSISADDPAKMCPGRFVYRVHVVGSNKGETVIGHLPQKR